MKKCAYCGRENDDAAGRCRECGTEFAARSFEAQPAAPRDWTWVEWLRYVLSYAGMVFFIGLIYLLSLGPVERCLFKVSPRTSTITTNTVNGHPVLTTTIKQTVSYPRWVGVVYYPAFLVRTGHGGNWLYARYLDWWGRRPGEH